MYRYRKSHRYASVLQSILVQVLLRETQGFTTSFLHVYSHLLDHIYLPHKKHQMKIQEREQKMAAMQKAHKEKTMFYLEGNFRADRLCEELPENTLHNTIQIHSASLPRFILKDTDTNDYASADMHSFLTNIFKRNRRNQQLEDHSELENSKFSPEVDWNASIWPISDKHNTNDKLLYFQYKLKTDSLATPAKRFYRQTATKNVPTLTNASCPVCLHPTQEADTAHIFSHCTVAQEHNKNLWESLLPLIQTTQSNPLPWFTVEDNNTQNTMKMGDSEWSISQGDLGYIPTHISQLLNKETYALVQTEVAESRHKLWKDYWSKYIQILKTSPNITPSTSATPTGDPPPGQAQPGCLLTLDAPLQNGMDGGSNKKRQATIKDFFKNNS
jgi:hypothetical protein